MAEKKSVEPKRESKAVAQKKVAPTLPDDNQELEDFAPREKRLSGSLKIDLSASLLQKLQSQAIDEGISIEEYVKELLSESVTLRAWEIMERKVQMRGGNNTSVGNSHNSGMRSGNNNNNNNRQNRGGGRRMSTSRYQNIMDDKATFLEYVRNQERQQR